MIVWPEDAKAVFRGLGLPTVKSLPLSSVSVRPFALRMAAVVFERTAVGTGPSKQLVPAP